jgi:hypothetical protein
MNNLYQQHPEIVKRLNTEMQSIEKSGRGRK